MKNNNIRNFSIVAHIDHGKSTLADRILEFTGAINEREMREQLLDSMDLERERGITIKATAVRLKYQSKDGEDYTLNLIDTPGHVDFSYEVSRSLAGCEGALLLIDASQGVEAQTLANTYLALEHNLEIIPIISKIDLPAADVEKAKREIEDGIGLDASTAVLTSAKEGIGTQEVLEAVVSGVPPPAGSADTALRALVFDSTFDPYKGSIVYIRVFDGTIKNGMKIKMMSTGKNYEVFELGVFTPQRELIDELRAGEVGYFAASIKDVRDTKIGDTVTSAAVPADTPLPGYRDVKPMVFSGLYPTDNADYENLRDSVEKLRLNDASFAYEPETSGALGFGFRCGFLGLLHMDIIQERLEREYDLNLIITTPSVIYRVHKTDGIVVEVDNPAALPSPQDIDFIEEPYIDITIITSGDYVGGIMQLAQEKRGIYKGMEYVDKTRAMLHYHMPLAEIIVDFYDRLKSVSKGYASMDYDLSGYRRSDLIKLDILVAGEVVDALSTIVHKDKAYDIGRRLTEKLKTLIPRQLFTVPIQASIGSKIIARETVSALRKNVLAKCYGGDVTRKRKLLERQKEGKKRMKQVGQVEIPQEAFMAVLKSD